MATFGRGTKRPAPVRCAAANDDEDYGGSSARPKERTSASSSSASAQKAAGKAEAPRDKAARTSSCSTAEPDKPGKKKAKEFAWMDSDDDNADEESAGGEEKQEAKSPLAEAEENKPVTVEALDEVQSFGRMMMLSEGLRALLRAHKLGAEEVAAACRALARAKFFDRELLDDLYEVIKKYLKDSKLQPDHVHDVVLCLHTLNAYDADLCSMIARCYLSRVAELDVRVRNEWLEIFKHFNHNSEPAFLQLLEVPPVPPMHPNYKRVRCRHFSRGKCEIGDSCTYSHDMRAPLSLTDHTNEDWWKLKSSVMMTQNQKCMGNGSYGTGPLGFPSR